MIPLVKKRLSEKLKRPQFENCEIKITVTTSSSFKSARASTNEWRIYLNLKTFV